jgi:hypothetical protein
MLFFLIYESIPIVKIPGTEKLKQNHNLYLYIFENFQFEISEQIDPCQKTFDKLIGSFLINDIPMT